MGMYKTNSGKYEEIQILGGAHSLTYKIWASDEDFLENFILPSAPHQFLKWYLTIFLKLINFWVPGIGAVKLLELLNF